MDRGVESPSVLEEERPRDPAGSLALLGSALAARRGVSRVHYSRDSNLEDVVLDQLLPQHDDAELNAQLHEAAPRGALQEEKRKDGAVRPGGAQRGKGANSASLWRPQGLGQGGAGRQGHLQTTSLAGHETPGALLASSMR